MTWSVGSLVRVRQREWVVLPESKPEEQVLWLRPLGGGDEERCGVYLPLEKVEDASFPWPDPQHELGNHRACVLLREALRLGVRAGAGPFRCFAKLAVEPRPYQLVPLLMALRQEIVRLLIADDVGIGKTVEALLIARELLDRGEIQRIAVLCPPHLAEGWVEAMQQQFHIAAVPVLASTAARLEKGLGPGESLFDHHPFVVVSMDFIKSERRRNEFAQACPDFVIVDEAHGCASAGGRAQQQRHALLQRLAAKTQRHLVLVSATPHSGDEEAFRSLLALLSAELAQLPQDLAGEHNKPWRERLAKHLVQRRRADIKLYLDAETPFPERMVAEDSYELSPALRSFLDKVLEWCQERVYDSKLDERRRRVQWWAALGLLRALSSSPRAAYETLQARARNLDAASAEEADDLGRKAVLDQDDASTEGSDVTPGALVETDASHPEHQRLLALAQDAKALEGSQDRKLDCAAVLLRALVDEGRLPIVFCRFLATVDYLGEHLPKLLGKNVHVERITGALPPEERTRRIEALHVHERRVLVCTDCLSEGINLQHLFDAVFHYDLSWNPTRHEQREGRVDRFGQPRTHVKALTFYGKDNPVDGLVLNVLLRKHRAIHSQLGISVPVPTDTDALVEALLEGGLLRAGNNNPLQLSLFTAQQQHNLNPVWDNAAEREKRSRAIFAQHSIRLDEVKAELAATRGALGDAQALERFVRDALAALGAPLGHGDQPRLQVAELDPQLARSMGLAKPSEPLPKDVKIAFQGHPWPGVLRVGRAHPLVQALAARVAETALDPLLPGPARRCGVVRTQATPSRAHVLLLRVRMRLLQPASPPLPERELLAEELVTLGFRGKPDDPQWLGPDELEALLHASPAGNIAPELARHSLTAALAAVEALQPHLARAAHQRAQELLDAHRRVRAAASLRLRGLRVEPFLPADLLALFLYLPAGGPA